jgi:DNA methyltransferase 1-associated protein 1
MLQLKHWTPAQADHSEPYKFAAFNTASPVFSYTSEEFQKHLRDPDWTREETDYLFDLCRTYDLRFIIVHDRYDWPREGPARSLEDLKDRYYSCCRRLLRERPTAADDTAKAASVNAYAFDKGREVARKEYLKSLLSRTPAQIAEEEFLYVESRRLEQTYAKVSREREDLLRMLAGPGSGVSIAGSNAPGVALPALGNSLAASTLQKSTNRRRSVRGGTEDDFDAPAPGGGKGKGKAKVADPAFDAQHFIARLDPHQPNPYGVPRSYNHMVGGPSVCLRSTRLPHIKTALQPRVFALLGELGLSQRLVMPTIVNQDRLEALVDAAGLVADLKRQLDRADYEIKVAKERTVASTVDAEGESADEVGSSVAGADATRVVRSIGFVYQLGLTRVFAAQAVDLHRILARFGGQASQQEAQEGDLALVVCVAYFPHVPRLFAPVPELAYCLCVYARVSTKVCSVDIVAFEARWAFDVRLVLRELTLEASDSLAAETKSSVCDAPDARCFILGLPVYADRSKSESLVRRAADRAGRSRFFISVSLSASAPSSLMTPFEWPLVAAWG